MRPESSSEILALQQHQHVALPVKMALPGCANAERFSVSLSPSTAPQLVLAYRVTTFLSLPILRTRKTA